ncbi:uncharacterized protein LOC111613106 [Centruroides sculpturatus]|uniref:uncharacterized protein LOC111613106 n=1 Tax=Centruroides sculpturatus TaxID=218467 RepID=UPI000C6DCCFD|nr:uncharacterized protein LOC111613106 [Centruroides sculpturatus]
MIYIFLISLMCVVFEVNAYKATIRVPKVDGKCEINGKLFKPREEYMNEQKCEVWTCLKKSPRRKGKVDKEHALVDVSGCGTATMSYGNGTECSYKITTGNIRIAVLEN